MAEREGRVGSRMFPWWRSGFDFEGILGFLAGLLFGILLSLLWDWLFWLGFIPGVIVLFATRTARRVTPEEAGLIVAPCDGVVVSVAEVDPPAELRLDGRFSRIRISSSPLAVNNIHAPIGGRLDHLIVEDGAPEAFLAMDADRDGLALLFATMEGDQQSVGLRVATGGLGPRLQVRADAGDRIPAGRTIATRRLGGWCDVFVPADARLFVEAGRTLVGGESLLCDFEDGGSAVNSEEETDEVQRVLSPTPETVPAGAMSEDEAPDDDAARESPAPETVPESVAEAVEDETVAAPAEKEPTPETVPPGASREEENEASSHEMDRESPTPETVPEDVAEEVETEIEDDKSADKNDPAEMFARLRREASKFSDEKDDKKGD